MTRFDVSKTVCMVVVCCTAMAIASPAQTLTTLVQFDKTNGGIPDSTLIQGADGNLYGTTVAGGDVVDSCGSMGCGTVFKMTPQGTLTTLYEFCSQLYCADGLGPEAGLVQGADGNFYGTTYLGGANNSGTVFKITPSGTLTTIYSFCSISNCADGTAPEAGLVRDSNGNFYGTTRGGGNSNSGGTVYKITPSGTLTTLYSFCSNSNCPDGRDPWSAPVLGLDGNFYGTTRSGGNSNSGGTVYKLTPSGTLTTLYSFCSASNCTDGSHPDGGLMQAAGSDFYGTTEGGGSDNDGTVFKITTGGTLTTLYVFAGTDGSYPEGSLITASDGNFYGTTSNGGNPGEGTIFKMTPAGTLTTLYTFCSQGSCSDGISPNAALLQAGDGNFYGTNAYGGSNNVGTVFTLSGPPPSALQFVPVTPCRLVDTRNANGTFGGPAIQGQTSRSFPVPQGSCNIPTTAAAYSFNVTVVPSGPLGYLIIWPTGEGQPLVSTMNSLDGRIKANAAIVPAGTNGAVNVYVSNTTNVILDVDGYFAPPSGSTLAFYPLTPCRVLDTRNANGDLGGPFLTTGVERDFPMLESTCNIPSTAEAYSMNFTVVPYQGQSLGYLTVWPQGSSQPKVSTLNNLTATIVANGAIVPAGTNGGIATYPSGNTHLVADIDGYFAPAGSGGLSLYTLAPCRVIDTRKIGNGQPFSGTLSPPVDVVDSVCAPPSTAQAYVFNATAVPAGGLGYLTLWPDSEDQPKVSTLNAIDGAITSNMAIVPNVNGKIDAFASGTTQLILDISSYFAP